MPFNLKQAMEFNKFTLGVSGGGFAYISKLASETHDKFIKTFGLLAIAGFATAVVFGVLVMGRATKLPDDATDDVIIRQHGQKHTISLIISLILSGVLMAYSVIFGPEVTK